MPPRPNIDTAVSDMSRVWQAAAKEAAHIAASKRTFYLAYLAEGFTEAQALELIKTL